MIIRQMNEQDIQEIVHIIIQYKKEQKNIIDKGMTEAITEQLSAISGEYSETAFVCSMENRIAAYINMHVCYFPLIGGKELYISDLLVKREYRAMGIGKLLMLKAEEFAKKNGCMRMMLNNGKNSESYMKSFYRKIGFNERDTFANFVKKL